MKLFRNSLIDKDVVEHISGQRRRREYRGTHIIYTRGRVGENVLQCFLQSKSNDAKGIDARYNIQVLDVKVQITTLFIAVFYYICISPNHKNYEKKDFMQYIDCTIRANFVQ